MSQAPIISVGDSAALVLSAEMLKSIGLEVGDVVEVTAGDGQLILRPATDPTRRRRVEQITEELLNRRRDAYQRLA